MRYDDFKCRIQAELRNHTTAFSWAQLQNRLKVPCARPWPTWLKRLKVEIGLARTKSAGPAYIWRLDPRSLKR